MSERDPVRIEEHGEIALVVLDRPERRNALNSTAARAVGDAIASVGDARAIVLTGSGGSFCAGGDLDELERWSDLDPQVIADTLYEAYQGMILAIRSSSAVVIAAVDGAAVGAGLDLALACDLRIASARARFGQVWVRLGVIPGTGGAWLTQALIGPARAAEMLLTGELIDAERALEWGLVNEVVGANDLIDHARAVAERFLMHPRDGVIANKRAMVKATEAQLDAALEHARLIQPQRFTSDEFRAALKKARG
ncbi:MAG: enoyl-CoA hydratase/isomerase family protein [Actinomycetota bacterium]|nr:enoyl-CoA hydratase/isomerase family protein [Actinomycetota bacterium]